eukprot:4651765-Amphidinium_carterae.2
MVTQQVYRQALVSLELGRAVLALEWQLIRTSSNRRLPISKLVGLSARRHDHWGLLNVTGNNGVDAAKLHLRTRSMNKHPFGTSFPSMCVVPHQLYPGLQATTNPIRSNWNDTATLLATEDSKKHRIWPYELLLCDGIAVPVKVPPSIATIAHQKHDGGAPTDVNA